MQRTGSVGLIIALLAITLLFFALDEPTPQVDPTPPGVEDRDPAPSDRTEEDGPIAAPPIDASAFHALDPEARLSRVDTILATLEPAEAYQTIAELLQGFDPDREFIEIDDVLKRLLARMGEDPTSFSLPHDDLRTPKSEIARLISARLLFEAHQNEWYVEPIAEEFLTACESSKSTAVRMTLIEDIGELPEFEPAEVLIESVLLDSATPQDIESGTLALESMLFQQKMIRTALAAGEPLHPSIEGLYESAEDVPDATAFAKELLVEVALNRKQTFDTLDAILDLLVQMRARDEIDHVLARFLQPELLELVEDAKEREIRR